MPKTSQESAVFGATLAAGRGVPATVPASPRVMRGNQRDLCVGRYRPGCRPGAGWPVRPVPYMGTAYRPAVSGGRPAGTPIYGRARPAAASVSRRASARPPAKPHAHARWSGPRATLTTSCRPLRFLAVPRGAPSPADLAHAGNLSHEFHGLSHLRARSCEWAATARERRRGAVDVGRFNSGARAALRGSTVVAGARYHTPADSGAKSMGCVFHPHRCAQCRSNTHGPSGPP
jgi:hypothetical protein